MLPQQFLTAIRKVIADEFVLTDAALCWPYGMDATSHFFMPQIVVLPKTHDEVLAIIRLCNEFQVPIVPRGLGSGAVGGALPIHGGLVLSLARMNEIISIDAINRIMVAQPGVTNLAIQKAAAKYNFFWAPDPGSREFCSLGGNLSHNSSGPRAIKYGTVRENTLALRAVTGSGESLYTGAYTHKNVVGYDLTRLLIGSEGTLAIITEATLKLLPLPAKQMTLRALYRSVEGAVAAISAIMGQSELPSALEFMDKTTVELVRRYAGMDLNEQTQALLLIGIDGNDKSIPEVLAIIKNAAQNEDLLSIETAQSEEESHQLWQARRHLSPCLKHVAPKKINEDIVVPISRIPNLILGLEKLSKQYGINIVSFGHAGSGNIHVNLMYDPALLADSVAEKCLDEVFALVLSLNGSLSGEHGIGLNKQPFITKQLDAYSLNLMRQIKKIFDPNTILNPGKIFP